ncbi:Retrovirus-related Pol polyprotein like [Argiope bruennichi]|uniref:Retrovirus-related Pol polyprotein like n=1 Tax=Argiope bruennichi TaxID=94029 RepID=A0A8T0FFS4_ARGBR|nr:Retrovirus-related Pol polyprotein like [Argiope bruennichi]
MKDAEFTHLEVERQLINESGRIQLKKKDSNITENAYNVGSSPGQEMSKKSLERSGNVLDPTRSPGQYKKNRNPKGVGPWCKYCSRKGHTESKCYKKSQKEKKAFNAESAFYVYNPSAEVFAVSKDLEQFLVDSASTSHFCRERDWFKNFRELSPTKALLADKRHTCEVKGVGDIDFCIKDVKGDVHITLKDVLYAPNIRRNLISGAKMDLAGLKINWCNDVMRDMSKNHSVKGLEHVNVKTKYEPCIACNLGKATRTSLKNIVYKRVTKSVLEKVHMDLWGPAPVNSLGGSKYFLSIIDDFSRKVDAFTLKNKNKVFTVFREYLSRVERELGLKLKSVRTDNGMEFCHKEFEKFLRELGIKSERTTIFTPELNGVSERFNRSSMDAVRTLLQDSGLQPRFWAEALQNYVYTKNRCIHKLTEGKTPIEIWNKLQPKAKIGIFMGYAVSRRGYRVWLPKEGKIEESIHVKIDETKNGVQTLFGKIKRYDYAWYQLDQTLKDGSYTKLQDDKTCLPENSPLLNISTWERLEKPRKQSKRVDVFYYPPSKERLRSLNDAKRYCEKNNLVFDPDQFNFKPTTVNTRFDQKSDSEEETSIDSNSLDEANCIDIFQHEIYMSEIPKTYAETQNSPDKSKWDEAMSEEIEMMQSRKVWDLVEPNSNMKVLGCRWVYNIKQDEKNNVRKYKSRLVAQGFKQRPGVDFTDVFAPL